MLRVELIGNFEKEDLIRWFFHRMPMDQRHDLMLDRPVVYAVLTKTSPHEWPFDLRDEVHNRSLEVRS